MTEPGPWPGPGQAWTQPPPSWPEPRWPERDPQDGGGAAAHRPSAPYPAQPPRDADRPAGRDGPAGRERPGAARKRRGRRARRRPTTTGPAALTACCAAVLAAASLAGRPVFVGCVLVVQVALVAGWLRVVEVPGRTGGLVVGIGAALAVDVLLLGRPDDASLRPVAVVLAGAVLIGLFHQLVRRADRTDATQSLAACLFGAVLVVLAATWLPVPIAGPDAYVVAAMLAALAAAGLLEAVASALRLPRPVRVLVSVAAAGAAGAGMGTRFAAVTLAAGAVAGGTAGLLGAVAFAVAALSRRYASDRTLFAATIPVAAVGPAAYFLGRLLG